MMRCSVLGCKSDSGTKMPDLSFHSFPKDRALRNVWVAATGREGLSFTNARICCKHFEAKCFKRTKKLTFLLSGSVPTMFVQTPGPVQVQSMPVPNDVAEQTTCTDTPRVVEPIKVTSGPSLKCQGKISLGPDFNPVITDIKSEADLIKQEVEDPQSDDTLSLAEDADQLSDADQPSEDLIPLINAQVPLSNASDPLSDVKVEETVVGVDEVKFTRPVELTTSVELSKSVVSTRSVELTSLVEATRLVEETRAVEESTVALPLHLRQELSRTDCYNLIRIQDNQINKLSARCVKQRKKLHSYVQVVRRRDQRISNLRAQLEALRSFVRECGWEVSSSGGGKIDVRRIQIRSPNTVVGQKKPNRQLLIVKRDYKPPKSSVSAQHTSDIQTSKVGIKRTSEIIQESLFDTLHTSDSRRKSSVGVKRTLDIKEKSSVSIPGTSDVVQKSTVCVKHMLNNRQKTSVSIPDTSNVLQKSSVGVKRILNNTSIAVQPKSVVPQTSSVNFQRTSDVRQNALVIQIDGMHSTVSQPKLVRLGDNSMETG